MNKRSVTIEQANRIAAELGIDLSKVDAEQFRIGLEIEFEHGSRDPDTDVTHDSETLTGKIAWAHLKEIPDYYTRLVRLEAEANGHGKPDR